MHRISTELNRANSEIESTWQMNSGIPAPGGQPVTARANVILSATFTADPFVDSLDLFIRETGLDLGVVLAPYGQVFQELLDRTRPFFQNRGGVNVVLVRFEDWVREANGQAHLREDRVRVASLVDDLVVALGDAAKAMPAPIVLCLCPSALDETADQETRAFLESLETKLLEGVAGLPSVHVLPTGTIATVSTSIYDAETDRLGHVPYTPAFFVSMAIALARLIRALKSAPRKVLVLDCDHTLWRGGIGEDGIEGLTITAQHRALQRFALTKKSEGMLLCLASKNIEADVMEVFRDRKEMILQTEDIAAMRVNWLPKSENLKSLARELNLGLDSFVLLDDNPVECAEVEANCPGVLAICLPGPDDFPNFLANIWPLDHLQVTDEDLRRTEAYRQNHERSRHQDSATTFDAFLESLELRIDIAQPRPDQFARVAQLSQRTNQFNCTTNRRNEGQIAQLERESKECRIVEVKDRFGDYGLVGLFIFGSEGPRLVLDTMLLSCRALGRGVEHAMLRELGAIAKARGLSHVVAPFIPTKKNLPAQRFLDGLKTESREQRGQETRYLLSAEQAATVVYAAGSAAPTPVDEPETSRPETSQPGAPDGARSSRWNRIARDLDTPEKVLALLERNRKRRRVLPDDLAAPRTETERKLCAIWADELGLSEVGIRDDYFDVGGTSLAAVIIFARIERELGRRLPLAMLMECKTVESLAARVDGADEIQSMIVLERGGGKVPLFLVHDADGETLLYRNLARRLDGRPVYGIQPHSRAGVPIVHTRIQDMAAHYVAEIRKIRPHGPYLLGGLCAGGVLAFEMARQLEIEDEEARLVAVFDAADADARPKRNPESARRFQRLRQAISAAPIVRIPRLLVSKVRGYLGYQLQDAVRRASDRLSVASLRRHLDKGTRLRRWVPQATVRTVYAQAEAEYHPQHVLREEIVLFRATTGIGAEGPYAQLYDDPLLGWGKRSSRGVKAIDVPGGHGSMLQEPNVASLAEVLISYLANVDWTKAPGTSATEPLPAVTQADQGVGELGTAG